MGWLEPKVPNRSRCCGRRRRCALVAALAAFVALGAAPVLRAESIDLTGRVTDDEGAPVAAARVELLPVLPRFEAAGRTLAGHLRSDAVSSARTAGDGAWSLVVPEPGMWLVEISAPGKIPVRHRLTPLTAHRELETAVLEPDGGAWIAVVDEEDRAIAEAQVWMRPLEDRDPRNRRQVGRWRPRGRFARTDPQGNASLSRVREKAIEVWAFAPGFVPSEAVTVTGDRGRLVLRRGRPLPMRFFGPDGEPAAGVIVAVGSLQWVAARTDARGRVDLHLLPGEPLTFALQLANGQRESGTLEAVEEDFRRGEDEVEEMTLPPPRLLAGRVVDAATRDPVAAAWVWSSADPGRVERVDRAGRYALVESSAGYWQIGATAPGYRPALQRKTRDEEVAAPTMALRRATALAGRVVDLDGAAVAGATVVAAGHEEPLRRPGEYRATSGGDGRFRLDGVAAGASYDLRVTAEGFAPSLRAARAESAVELEIILAPSRAVLGRVVSVTGDAVSGAEVIAAIAPQSRGSRQRLQELEPIRAMTAADGVFRLDGLPAETLVLVARKAGFAPRQVPLIDVLPPAGESVVAPPVDLGDVVLEPESGIAGVVTNGAGDPVEAVRVRLLDFGPRSPRRLARSPFEQPESYTTDAEGRFRVGGLLEGREVALTFDHLDYLPHSLEGVEAGGDEPLEVVLERAATLSGRVEDEALRPVAGAGVQARPLGGRRGMVTSMFSDPTRQDSTVSEEDGSFELGRVAPGVVELEAAGAGYVSAGAIELVVEPGESREGLVLAVKRGRTVDGTVRDSARRAVAGAIIQVSRTETRSNLTETHDVATAQSDSDGRFRLEGLAPDAARLTVGVHHPEYLSRRIELMAGDRRLDVVLERGHRVSGTVFMPNGDPATGASVGLDGGGGVYFGGSQSATSGADGGFEIEGVGPGVYRLFAMKEGLARTTSPEEVEVVDRPLSGLSLRLSPGGTIRGRVLGLELGELGEVRLMADSGFGGGATAYGYLSDDGSYTVPQVAFGQGTVRAFLLRDGRSVAEEFALDTEGGETWVDLDFGTGGGSTLSGTVLLDGEPWGLIRVAARGGLGSQGVGQADSAGRFEIRDLTDGRHQLLLMGGSVMAHSELVDVVGDTEVTVDVATVTLRGTVVAAGTREPVARAEVAAEGLVPGWMERWAGRVLTTGSGSFELVVPAQRQVTVRARAAGRGDATITLESGPGPVVDGLEMVLEPAGEIELDVRLASGLPVTWVSALVVDAQGRSVARDEQTGPIRMPIRIVSVPPGQWTLLVAADGSAQVALPVSVPGPPVVVTLTPESRVALDLAALEGRIGNATLRVLGPSGAPVALAAFEGLGLELPIFEALTELSSLPAGEWVLEVRDDRGQVWRREVTTAAGETARVVFD